MEGADLTIAPGPVDDLGGLWVVSTRLRFKAGNHGLVFSEPLLAPMERLDLDAPLGELTLVQLGNASPREVEIHKNIGHGCIDLRGAWRTDATMALACGVGSCDLHEPGEDDAVVQVEGTETVGTGGVEPSGLPLIHVRVAGALPNRVEVVEVSARLQPQETTPDEQE